MGGGGGHATKPEPYPRWVWSPTGGPHPLPSNWRMNTFIWSLYLTGIGILAFRYGNNHTHRHTKPERWSLDMLWHKEYNDGVWERIPRDAPRKYIPIADRPKVPRPDH